MKFSILFILIFILLLCAVLLMIEDKMIYFPAKYPEGIWNPGDYGVIVEDAFFKTEDGLTLHAWFVPSNENKITILWFHGNAGNISHRLENIKFLHELDINIFIFDYRGYGRSEEEFPSEKTIYSDSRAAYLYLIQEKNIPKETLFFFGRSLGGAVAVEMAKEFGCSGLIIESSFSSAKEMAGMMFPFLPVKYFIKTDFNSHEKIKNIFCPKLFIHGNEDNIVPFKLGRKLFDAAPEPKEFFEIDEAGHNDTYIVGGNRYFNAINHFIRSNYLSTRTQRQKE